MNVLVVDVGGSNVKILATGQDEPRKFSSGPKMTAEEMVSGVKELAAGWEYDVVSIGYPGSALRDRVVSEPHNLAKGWVGFDFPAAFGCPVKLINDAAMQALGSYKGGKLLFLGLGTGLGSAMVVDGIVEPMELGHLPYKKGTYEDYVGVDSLERRGKKKWRKHVAKVVAYLTAALQPDDVVLGGGNMNELEELPPGCRAGDNANAFLGGFRMWEDASGRDASPLGERQPEGKVKRAPGHVEDRPNLDRLQEELDAARRALRDCQHTLQSHLKLAAKVHESFLPQSVRHSRLNISAAFIPVDGLGGDYCQTIFPNDLECYLTICDVTGHGIDAALLASRVSSEVRYLVLQHLRPWQIVSEINTFVWKYFRETNLQLSLFVAHLDLVEGRVTHSGAGHPPQLLIRRDGRRVDKLVSQNMLIGVQQECMSVEPEQGKTIEVGDHLVFFTDGLPETSGADGQLLREDQLIELAMASHCRSAANMAECILERVRAFGAGAQRDDLTLIMAELTS